MQKTIICNKNFDKKHIKNLIEWFLNNYGSIRTGKLLYKVKNIGFKYASKIGISLSIQDLLIPKIKQKLIFETEKYLKRNNLKLIQGKINKLQHIQKLIETWNITNETLKKEIIKNFRQTDLLNPVYMMIFSGARGNLSQIKQLIGMRGLMADSKGEIINVPIKTNLKEGLNASEYFVSCYGARKGIIDTALKTANSGYLTRRLVYVSQSVFIQQPDCHTKTGTLIKTFKKTKKSYLKTKEKILGRIIAENIINKKNNKKVISNGQDICNYIAKKLIKTQLFLFIRTCFNCQLNLGLCQLCYGWNLANNKIINIAENVGILAAQSIGEPGTQLTMRTFHTGGIFTSELVKVIQAPNKGVISYSKKNTKTIITKHGEKALLSLVEKIIFLKRNKLDIKRITIPKFSIILVNSNSKVFNKYIIGEIPKWKNLEKNKENKEIEGIKTENSGQLIFDIRPKNKKNNILWLKNGSVIKSKNIIKKRIKLIRTMKKYYFSFFITNKLEDKTSKTNYMNFRKLKNIIQYKKVKYKEKYKIHLIRKEKILINKEKNIKQIKIKSKLGTFKQKLSFPAQVIEERKNKKIVKKAFAYFINKDSILKGKNNTIVDKNSLIFEIVYEKKKTSDIVEGLPKVEEILEAKKNRNSKIIKNNTQEKLKKKFFIYKQKYNNENACKKTFKKIQTHLVKEIQNVYEGQGVYISNKHIEIIIKQMTSKVIVKNSGDSKLLLGEIIDFNKLQKLNKVLSKKVIYEPLVLGISRVAMLSNSFISATCFQESIRMLTKSAIMGKIDWLKGLKENLILGNLIPTGTGYNLKN